MENKFEILSYSKIRMALLMLFSSTLALLLTILGGKIFGEVGLKIAGGISILIGLLNTFITPKYLAKSVVEIYFKNTGLEITCVKPFYGSKISRTILVSYQELKSYKFESTNYFSTFKITLKNGTTHKFHRWYNDNDDQYDKFYSKFTDNIKAYNKRADTLERIERQKTLFENRTFLLSLAIIIFMLILSSVVLLSIKGVQNKAGIITLLIFMAPLSWVITKVVNGFKK